MKGAPAKPISGTGRRGPGVLAQRLEHEAHRLGTSIGLELRDVRLRPHGAVDHRALALRELEPDAERLDDQQDVGEEDRRVDAEALDGLERDLGGRLGVVAELEEAVALAQRAVLGHVAPGLTHEPDRTRGRRGPCWCRRGAAPFHLDSLDDTHPITRHPSECCLSLFTLTFGACWPAARALGGRALRGTPVGRAWSRSPALASPLAGGGAEGVGW